MQWIPLNIPRPEDGRRYDIRLSDGTVVTNVTYWDYGGGFDPLELESPTPPDGQPVKYPLSQVTAFRPAENDNT